jgi:hypothetical protein
MLVVILSIYIIGLYLCIRNPTYFVLFYILTTTKYLGFFDVSLLIVSGIEIGFFSLNILTLLGSLLFSKWYYISKNGRLIIFTIILMLIYGIVKPSIDGNSTLLQSLIASKEIWYYSLLFYLLVHRNRIDKAILIKWMKFLGVYLGAVYIIGAFNHVWLPPYYFDGETVRVFYPTYINLALLLYAIEYKFIRRNRIKTILIILLLLMGIILAGHSSLIIMAVIGLITYILVYSRKLRLSKGSIIGLITMLALASFLLILFNQGMYISLSASLEEVITGNNLSLSTRKIYNEFRWEAIYKEKEFGYGFIHQSSEIMKLINTNDSNRFMERLGVIDSGYIDMFTKFGFIGTFLILIVFFRYFRIGFIQKTSTPLSLAMSIYLAQYFFLNYTWSVFTFAHGIVPGIVALFLILSTKIRKETKSINNVELMNRINFQ